MTKGFLGFSIYIITFYFLFAGLYYGANFLIPLVFASILAMLLEPISTKMEDFGIKRAFACLLSVFLIVIFIACLFWLLIGQIESLSKDLPKINQELSLLLEKFQNWAIEKSGIPNEKIQQFFQTVPQRIVSFLGNLVKVFLSRFFNTAADVLLSLIYVFCFLYYKDKFKEFILKIVPENQKERSEKVITNTSNIARQYLVGRLLLILFLAIFYSIGFSIIGLKHAIFLSIFASIFSLIPYIGNIIGIFFPCVMALIYSNGAGDLIGVIIVFSIVQFIESYILEPLVVGGQVNLNPFFVILGVVLGGIIWGVAGLILAIPIMGILKVLFENIPPLTPFGFLIAETESGGFEEKIKIKIREWWKKIK